jgi:hypothetical protein
MIAIHDFPLRHGQNIERWNARDRDQRQLPTPITIHIMPQISHAMNQELYFINKYLPKHTTGPAAASEPDNGCA